MLGKPQHQPQVGYQIFHEDGMDGARGLYYNFVLAGNGLFIEAESPLLDGRVQVVKAQVRGLPPLTPEVCLAHGRIPLRLLELGLNDMLATPELEIYLCIVYEDGAYSIKAPQQQRRAGSVEYECLDNVALDLHSHGGEMEAFFSSQDNKDEQGLRLYGVVGGLYGVPHMRMRLGIYGYFGSVEWGDVFGGPPGICQDLTRKEKVLIPEYDPDNPTERYPGGILPGSHELVKLLRDAADNPEAIRFIADMLEEWRCSPQANTGLTPGLHPARLLSL